jgi:hypothetical protein
VAVRRPDFVKLLAEPSCGFYRNRRGKPQAHGKVERDPSVGGKFGQWLWAKCHVKRDSLSQMQLVAASSVSPESTPFRGYRPFARRDLRSDPI